MTSPVGLTTIYYITQAVDNEMNEIFFSADYLLAGIV
jgi:hypothetical protein